MLQAQIDGLLLEFVLTDTRELGKRATANAEHVVTRLKAGDAFSDGLDSAGDVHPRYRGLGLPQAVRQANQVGLPSPERHPLNRSIGPLEQPSRGRPPF